MGSQKDATRNVLLNASIRVDQDVIEQRERVVLRVCAYELAMSTDIGDRPP